LIGQFSRTWLKRNKQIKAVKVLTVGRTLSPYHFAKSTSVGDINKLLHIKTFIGTSQNAVMIQIWTALITIMLLKVMKAPAKYGWHLSNLVAFIRLDIFEKTELQKWLDRPFEDNQKPPENIMQGVLFPNSS
jgi:hypothetical protein